VTSWSPALDLVDDAHLLDAVVFGGTSAMLDDAAQGPSGRPRC
jgi:hypothetical protein